MKALRFAFMTLIRDWKSGELAVMAFALLVAVTSLTAVGFFTSRVSTTVTQQAGEVLAADLRLRSGRPIDPRYFEIGKENRLRMAEVQSLPSVIFHLPPRRIAPRPASISVSADQTRNCSAGTVATGWERPFSRT